MQYLLGIDTSTTATKALLTGDSGAIVGVASSTYGFDAPRPGWTEQAASLFWEGTVASVRRVFAETGVDPADVACIGLTGQMHGMTLLDAAGQAIRPVILWNDQRTAAQCEAITTRLGARHVIELTGNPALTGFTAPKILWTREHEPEAYRRVAKVLLPKDYVRYRLSGAYVSDVSDASGTSLFDVRQRRWSAEMLAALDLPVAWLPDVVESPRVCAWVNADGARATGLRVGTPIVGGGGDQAAAAVGTGIAGEGRASISLGTSGVVFAASSHFRADPEGRLHAFCHAVPGMWHVMGVMLSAAGSLRWWRETLAQVRPDLSYDDLNALAEAAPAGCDGVLFQPYLTGERAPHPDPDARGAFHGLTVRHGLAHMTRAVLEGVAFGLRDSFEIIRDLSLTFGEIRATGGGARSDPWRQILADALAADIILVNSTEGAAFGAALLAGVGAGVWPSVPAACEAAIHETQRATPGPDRAVYERQYAIYHSLYAALAPIYPRMTAAATTQ